MRCLRRQQLKEPENTVQKCISCKTSGKNILPDAFLVKHRDFAALQGIAPGVSYHRHDLISYEGKTPYGQRSLFPAPYLTLAEL